MSNSSVNDLWRFAKQLQRTVRLPKYEHFVDNPSPNSGQHTLILAFGLVEQLNEIPRKTGRGTEPRPFLTEIEHGDSAEADVSDHELAGV
jgi:hypothetical protein